MAIRKIETRHIGTLYIDEFTEPDKNTAFEDHRIYVYDSRKKPIDYFTYVYLADDADNIGCSTKEVYNQIIRDIKAVKSVEGFFKNIFLWSAELITDCAEDLFKILDCKTKEEVLENEFVVLVNNHYVLLRE